MSVKRGATLVFQVSSPQTVLARQTVPTAIVGWACLVDAGDVLAEAAVPTPAVAAD